MVSVALVGSLVAVLGLVSSSMPATPAYLCIGYDACKSAGYKHAGYKAASSKMWWRMYSGHNCTNYAAYRVIKNGYSTERPWTGSGNATNWGVAMKSITDQSPAVGAIAWWKANSPGVGSAGHVAYVEQVVSATEIVISEDSWGGDFSWRRITKSSNRWPTGFIHFNDQAVQNTSPPALSGTPVVGATLTATVGAWSPAKVTTTLQWYADGVPIAGATGTKLSLTPAERKKVISVVVKAAGAGLAAATATGTAATKVALGEFGTVTEPRVEGVPEAGGLLTVTPGELTPPAKKTKVQWYADDEPIPDATDWQLKLSGKQVDAQVRAGVSAKAAGYKWADVPTATTDPVVAGRVVATTPSAVTGAPLVGETLTVAPGDFTPTDAQVTHSWLRNGLPVATGTAYRITKKDLGASLTLRVEATKDKWRTATEDLLVADRIRTRSTLKVTPKSKKRAAVVKVRVKAPGANPVTGKVEIKVGKQISIVKLVNGRARLKVAGLKRGQRSLRVTYMGTANVEAARLRNKVLVR